MKKKEAGWRSLSEPPVNGNRQIGIGEPLSVERQDGPFEEQGKGGDPNQKGAHNPFPPA
jgi:hypothetical protein